VVNANDYLILFSSDESNGWLACRHSMTALAVPAHIGPSFRRNSPGISRSQPGGVLVNLAVDSAIRNAPIIGRRSDFARSRQTDHESLNLVDGVHRHACPTKMSARAVVVDLAWPDRFDFCASSGIPG
jgi:hypothetical protein